MISVRRGNHGAMQPFCVLDIEIIDGHYRGVRLNDHPICTDGVQQIAFVDIPDWVAYAYYPRRKRCEKQVVFLGTHKHV